MNIQADRRSEPLLVDGGDLEAIFQLRKRQFGCNSRCYWHIDDGRIHCNALVFVGHWILHLVEIEVGNFFHHVCNIFLHKLYGGESRSREGGGGCCLGGCCSTGVEGSTPKKRSHANVAGQGHDDAKAAIWEWQARSKL